ncbi:MAG: PEP-CTERM sorting domain-containing protein [Roseateles sp.]|uniref:EDSAP-1 family PEP-CTERM protein n=1 Tax=Roseateles sp. TaxID=1971397 RepID=UPI0039E985A4
MKFKVLAGLVATAASLMASQAQAGAVGIANMHVTGLGFAAPGAPTLTISGESRTGNATASYNGVVAGGAGPNAITANGAVDVDVKNRCAGACDGSLYNGTNGGLENATNHISVPGGANYALGDMFISGTALGGSISGLTRADAVVTGPTNFGGANSTIGNSGRITGSFTVGTTFTSALFVNVDAFIQAWVDPLTPAGDDVNAFAGYGWNMSILGSDGSVLEFAPADMNKSYSASDSLFNAATQFSTNGTKTYLSDAFTFKAGVAYQFAINQSSNATAYDKSPLPEPASLALLGVAALGAGFASRRRKAA